MLLNTEQSILQEIQIPEFKDRGIQLFVKRDDLIDPFISGNKWRKLKYIVALAEQQRKLGLLTLGGAFSNHLLATAACCNRLGLKSIGLVRGEELNAESNLLLKQCADFGMELQFISRDEYGERYEKERQEIWKQHFPSYLFVPEGGAMYHGLIGCQEIWREIPIKVDHVFVAQGTATTSCGLLLGASESTKVHVVPALNGFDSIAEMRSLLYPFLLDQEIIEEYLEKVVVHSEFHFGGYAKTTPELIEFMDECNEKYDLPLDTVYTSKAFYGLLETVRNDTSFDGTSVLFLHTGGVKMN